MFDRCHRSWAVETPDKYERDLKFPITKKLTNKAVATPNPRVISNILMSSYIAGLRDMDK